MTVTARNVVVSVGGMGTVQAISTVAVRPRVDGLLSRVDGQSRGQLVAQLEPRCVFRIVHAAS